ncbi:MAG: hypothetical protein Q8K60_00790 [Parachlamydiaceae bacterium]|nr:hypothetical protein [Parachlamydiaceae bacterium]
MIVNENLIKLTPLIPKESSLNNLEKNLDELYNVEKIISIKNYENKNEIIELLNECKSFESILKLFKNNLFINQTENIKKTVISFIQHTGHLQKLISYIHNHSIEDSEPFWEHLDALIDHGFDINCFDPVNRHCLTIAKSSTFFNLWNRKARFPPYSLKEMKVLDQFMYLLDKENSTHQKIFKSTLLSQSTDFPLMNLFNKNNYGFISIVSLLHFNIFIFKEFLIKISKIYPKNIIDFGIKYLNYSLNLSSNRKKESINCFLFLFEEMENSINRSIFFSQFTKLSPLIYYPSLKKDLAFLKIESKNFYIERALNSSDLYYFLKNLLPHPNVQQNTFEIDDDNKLKLRKKIFELEETNRHSIWYYVFKYNISNIQILNQLDLFINWNDKNNKALLFLYFPNAIIEYKKFIDNSKDNVSPSLKNLLEFYCEYPNLRRKVPISKIIEELSEVDIEPLATLFIEKINNLNLNKFEKIVCLILHKHNYEVLKRSYLKDGFFKIITEKICKSNRELKSKYLPDLETKWTKKLKKYDRKNLRYLVKYRSYIDAFLNYITSFWEKKIPSKVLQLIPEQPVASLALSSFLRSIKLQNEKMRCVKYFFKGLNNEERSSISNYLILHPRVLSKIVKKDMTLRSIKIKHGGGSVSTYAKLIDAFIAKNTQREKLIKSPECEINKPFYEKLIPSPIESLEINEHAIITSLNRTIYVTLNEQTEAFKFLKVEENYDHFSQEFSVTSFFRQQNQFKSEFHKPKGIYLLNQIPDSFKPYLNNIKQSSYYIIYHYTPPSVDQFVYLQNADNFKFSRQICLADTVNMIALGIAPELGELFHSYASKRKYILFIDLAQKIASLSISTTGGAGRLDQAFFKSKWSNMRKTGLTDLRDVYLFRHEKFDQYTKEFNGCIEINKNIKSTLIFKEMMFLGNLLLIDMLVLTTRYIDNKKLDWTDEPFIQTFSEELLEGFTIIMSNFLKKPETECVEFCRKCGVDWLKAARQIAFWCDESDKGFCSYLKNEEIPKEIYGEDVFVDVKNKKEVWGASGQKNNLTEDFHLQTNGHQDIGCFNGPLGLTEFERIAHLLYFVVSSKDKQL